MKTSHALPLLTIVLAGSVAGAFTFSGCGSSETSTTPPPAEDSASDAVKPDTGSGETKPDTGTPEVKPDTGPLTCAADLPSDFACATPKAPTGATTCTEASLQEFATACVGSGTAADCTAWTKKYAECNKCITKFLSPKFYFMFGYCMAAVKSDSPCGKLFNCGLSCQEAVCEACDTTLGTGKSGSASSSEYRDCINDATFAGSATRPKGRCYDIATKDYKSTACSTTEPMSNCLDVVNFYRGACRDGGDWSHFMDPDWGKPDTGTDAPVDVGVDLGVGDVLDGG